MKKDLRVRTEKEIEREIRVREALRSLLFPLVIAAVIGAGVLFVLMYQEAPEPEEIVRLNSYEGGKEPVVMESERLLFTMDPLTTQFTVEVKDTGQVWHSNPPEAAADTKALPEERAKLQSPLIMSYSVKTGLEVTFNTFAYSIQNGIYEIERTGEDEVSVRYSLGDVDKEYVVPPVLVQEDYRTWTGLMEEKSAKLVGEYYKKYDLNKLGKKDNREELLAHYPDLENGVIYVLRDTPQPNTRKQIEGIFEAAGYTYDDYLADKERDLTQKTSDKPIFNITVNYRLEGDDLVVEVPFSEMAFKEEYPIYTVTPLPYFGAGAESDEGYLLVPEGGGAAIRFNNGKVSQSSYYTNIYGWNMCLGRDAVVHNTRACCGVFGVSEGEDSFLCLLEDGSAYASVQADISGRSHSYNFVNAVYSVCDREKYDVGEIANSDIYQYVEALPEESIIQRYRFVDSGSYVDMAKAYGSYLEEQNGDAFTALEAAKVPVVVEIVGAVDKVRQILGVPVSRPHKLTTFAEADEIIRDLSENGVENLSVLLKGWCNGGVKQRVLTRVKPVRSLGGEKGLSALCADASTLGVDLYLNGITQYAYDSGLLDGFFSFRDAAKFISRERASLREYSSVTYAERDDLDPYFLLHPGVSMRMAQNLAAAAAARGAGIAFEDTGKDLSADYYRKDSRSRQSVLEEQRSFLKNLKAEGKKVLLPMGNDYCLAMADVVTSMDLQGSGYTIIDERIPFLQLALHGKLRYTGKPLNICGSAEEELLACAEYGAGLSFTFMKESAFAIQKTLYTEYYGASYEGWRDRMLEIWERYDRELGHTFCLEMTDHENLTPTLAVTSYADGTRVYVNYGFTEAESGGVHIPPRDYAVVR